jgi:Zn-dependent protease
MWETGPIDGNGAAVSIVLDAKRMSINVPTAILFGGIVSWALGFMNTLPILPFDGGHVVEPVLKKMTESLSPKLWRMVRGAMYAGFFFLILTALLGDFKQVAKLLSP